MARLNMNEEEEEEEEVAVVVVVGSYCHDLLFVDERVIGEGLGGAAAFVSNVFHSMGHHQNAFYVSKVGSDFLYHGRPNLPPPLVSPSSPTTIFHANFTPSPTAVDRILRRVAACEPILPSDLHPIPYRRQQLRFRFGLAVGVAGEIPPHTLSRMLDVCDLVFVDVQALIRTFHPADGTVRLVPLANTPFSHLLPRIAFLKASAEEAPFLDLEEARRYCCVVVTRGKDGCTLYWKEGRQLHVPTFPAQQLDPTGAGDSFLGAFVGAIMNGLPVPQAALLGNFFGSLTVRHIGIPIFHPPTLQAILDEVNRITTRRGKEFCLNDMANLEWSKEEEEIMKFLANEAHIISCKSFHCSDGNSCNELVGTVEVVQSRSINSQGDGTH